MQYYQNYSVAGGVLEQNIKDILGSSTQPSQQDTFRHKVLRDFIKHGRLVQIPAQRKKRDYILEKIAEGFEFERRYAESEVNQIILEFHEDFATLRRELIGLGLLARENGVYWRVNPQ